MLARRLQIDSSRALILLLGRLLLALRRWIMGVQLAGSGRGLSALAVFSLFFLLAAVALNAPQSNRRPASSSVFDGPREWMVRSTNRWIEHH
jgi:hypothetical protein